MHVPVLAAEALDWLAIREDGCYVDCTAGAGGHSAGIAERLGPRGRLLAIDRDAGAVSRVRERLARYAQVEVAQGNYGDLAELIAGVGLPSVDGVLLDAGVSSVQLDDPERGFSFQADGPLDMRMDRSQGDTAGAWLAGMHEADLAQALRAYGDVRRPKRIAAAIMSASRSGAMTRTVELAEAVSAAVGGGEKARDETRRVFQAVRIAVNDELSALKTALESAVEILSERGRLVVITFHSGEDRIAKQVIREESRRRNMLHPDGRVAKVIPPRLRDLTPKTVTAGSKELASNRRAQSARLRAAERLPYEEH